MVRWPGPVTCQMAEILSGKAFMAARLLLAGALQAGPG